MGHQSTTRSPVVPGGYFSLTGMTSSDVPSQVTAAVLVQSAPIPDDAVSVKGPNFDENLSLQGLLGSYERIGFQATALGRAIKVVDKMVSKRNIKTINKHVLYTLFSSFSGNGDCQTNQ